MPTLTTLVDNTVPVAADFNNNYTALNQAIGTGTSITTYTTGDTLYASAANTLSKLTIGTSGQGQVLASGASGIPAWTYGGAIAGAGQLWGLTLSNDSGDATNDIGIAVGVAASDDAAVANKVTMSLTSALIKQLDAVWAVGTNAGMRASGAAIANTTYHIFLIMRPDTGVVDVAADTSATGANVAANTNAAYTKLRRIGSILREGGAIVAFLQTGDHFWRSTAVLDVSSNNPGTSAVTRTLSVPVGVKVLSMVNTSHVDTTPTGGTLYLSDLSLTDSTPATTTAPLGVNRAITGGSAVHGPVHTWTNTSAQIRSRVSGSDGNLTVYLATLGWVDLRGRTS